MRVDGKTVRVGAGVTVLDACDAAGHYVPRLCHYPGLDHQAETGSGNALFEARSNEEGTLWNECGLCVVRLGDGSVVQACTTTVAANMEITTDDQDLRAMRLERLARIFLRHPHTCLSCPDRDGCSRDECTYGHPPEARCCREFGRCELGKVAHFIDEALAMARQPVIVSREAVTEGRIRREAGLCIGCARCVRVCDTALEAGRALEMMVVDHECQAGGSTPADVVPSVVVRSKRDTLRASGCTFCGLCILVCPTGALTAAESAGSRWLDERRERSNLPPVVLPPDGRQVFDKKTVEGVPHGAGVFRLFDSAGQVLRIIGAADLGRALTESLTDSLCVRAVHFLVEFNPLYTQREAELLARYAQEKGCLPPGNEVDDTLFDDDFLEDDPCDDDLV